jgi:hypothetical protein
MTPKPVNPDQPLIELSTAATRVVTALRDLKIDVQYALVRGNWRNLPRHQRRHLTKHYAIIKHHRARRDRKAAGR